MDSCKEKAFYDTEGEAIRAAAITSYRWKAEIVPYQHHNHWHITNADRTRRGQHNKKYCEFCNCYIYQSRWPKHILKDGHVNRVRAIKKGH